jgi:Zn-finger protein
LRPEPEDLSETKSNSRGRSYEMNYKYFIHDECSFFPCHDLQEWKSCLFCWCPLYLLDCGGNFIMMNGIKDCSSCVIPHTEEGYDYILEVINTTIYQKSASRLP